MSALIDERLSFMKPPEIFHDDLSELLPAGIVSKCSGRMRGDDHLLMIPQRIIRWQRLFLRHIEDGAADLSLIQRLQDIAVIHQRPSADIDEHRILLHQREIAVSEEPLRL